MKGEKEEEISWVNPWKWSIMVESAKKEISDIF